MLIGIGSSDDTPLGWSLVCPSACLTTAAHALVITGQALVGELVGRQLIMLPAEIVAFADFKAAFPSGQVLSRDTANPRSYGSNPYVGYDDVNSSPFLYSDQKDGRLPPMERVVTVEIGGETAA